MNMPKPTAKKTTSTPAKPPPVKVPAKPAASPLPARKFSAPKPLDELEQSLATLDSGALDSLGDLNMDAEMDRLNRNSPLNDINPDGKDLEKVSAEEMSVMLKTFRERRDGEQARFLSNTDSEYWFCVCFQSREQKDAFLQAMDWAKHGDKYLDGVWVAKKVGVKLPEGQARFIGEQPERRLVKEVGLFKRKPGK